MDVLVTGAAGFVGHHLVAALCSRGDYVRALALPFEDTTNLEEAGARIYRGDVRQPDSLDMAMEGVDLVFHLAAIHGLWRPKQDYYTVNIGGTENVCRAALKANVSQLVYVSSWTVYGMGFKRPIDESFQLNPIPDIYTETKAEAEKRVRGFIENDRLPAVIVRPGTMFGPGDKVNFGRMAERLRDGKAIIIGSGRNIVPFVYVTDVVEGMILAGIQTKAVGQVYNLSTDNPINQERLWNSIAKEIGFTAPRLHVPYYPLYLLAYFAERAVDVDNSQRQPTVTRLGVKLFGADNQISIEKACRELGYAPKVSILDGVRKTAEWYNQQWSVL